MRRAMMKAADGGYPPGTILAYEFNESASPAVDAINGYEAVLGATMSIGGGVMATSNTDAVTDSAPTNDPTIYLSNGNPRTFEWFIDIIGGGQFPAIATIKHSSGSTGFYASNFVGYKQFVLGTVGSARIHFNTGVSYAIQKYHLVLVFDGIDITSPASYSLFINGVKFAGFGAGNLIGTTDHNAFGWAGGTTNGALDFNYHRVRDHAVSDAVAVQMYVDR